MNTRSPHTSRWRARTLAAVGAFALRTRRAVTSRTGSAIGRLLPIASAGAIAGLGLLLSAGALLHL